MSETNDIDDPWATCGRGVHVSSRCRCSASDGYISGLKLEVLRCAVPGRLLGVGVRICCNSTRCSFLPTASPGLPPSVRTGAVLVWLVWVPIHPPLCPFQASTDILKYWQQVYYLDSASWAVDDHGVETTPEMMNALLHAKETKMKRALVLTQRAWRARAAARPRQTPAGCARVSAAHGRCGHPAAPGSKYCQLHGCPACGREKASSSPACPQCARPPAGVPRPNSRPNSQQQQAPDPAAPPRPPPQKCARAGGCGHPPLPDSRYCQLHTCPECRQEKKSTAQYCPAHAAPTEQPFTVLAKPEAQQPPPQEQPPPQKQPPPAQPEPSAVACQRPGGCVHAAPPGQRFCPLHACPGCRNVKRSGEAMCPKCAAQGAGGAPVTVLPSSQGGPPRPQSQPGPAPPPPPPPPQQQPQPCASHQWTVAKMMPGTKKCHVWASAGGGVCAWAWACGHDVEQPSRAARKACG